MNTTNFCALACVSRSVVNTQYTQKQKHAHIKIILLLSLHFYKVKTKQHEKKVCGTLFVDNCDCVQYLY